MYEYVGHVGTFDDGTHVPGAYTGTNMRIV